MHYRCPKEEKRDKSAKNLFEKIMAKRLSNLGNEVSYPGAGSPREFKNEWI